MSSSVENRGASYCPTAPYLLEGDWMADLMEVVGQVFPGGQLKEGLG